MHASRLKQSSLCSLCCSLRPEAVTSTGTVALLKRSGSELKITPGPESDCCFVLEEEHISTSLNKSLSALYTLSVKLSDFTVWRHTWYKNWVNCTNLTGDSSGLRTIFSSRLSHRELRSSLRECHSFLTLPADTTMASSQGTSVSSNSFSRWTSHDSFSNTTSYSTFYAFFSSFRITLWPMWLGNSKRQPCFYPP